MHARNSMPARTRRARRWCAAVRDGIAALAMLATLPAFAAAGDGLCIAIVGLPDGKTLAGAPLHAEGASFAVTYVHATTRTPVRETYRADATGFSLIELRYTQPAPGLSELAGPGETLRREGEQFVLAVARRFDGVRLRARAEQSPTLEFAGGRIALAQWGEREIGLVPVACSSERK